MRFKIHNICIVTTIVRKQNITNTLKSLGCFIDGRFMDPRVLLPSVNSGVFYVGNNSQWRSQYFHRLSNYPLGLLNLWYFVLGSTYPPVADQGGQLLPLTMMDWLPRGGGGG